MQKIRFSDLPESSLPTEVGSVLRRFTGGANVTVAKIMFTAGSILPIHRHENEQFTVLLEGIIQFINENGEITEVCPGELMYLEANVWHGAKAVTDVTVLDIFAPVRADWGTPPEIVK